MVLQSELVAHWADGKRLAFIGDGDSIGVSVAYLHSRGILNYGPSKISVYDFDERICRAITRFAEKESIENLSAELYNVVDGFHGPNDFDCFYTNPPWGASNGGESVKVFLQRGFEATGYAGEGIVVIADDPELTWPQCVLLNVQKYVVDSGFYISRMMSQLHSYHLDDAPGLRSCNVMLRALHKHRTDASSDLISDPERLANFYGQGLSVEVQYIRERRRLDHGKAYDDEYFVEQRRANEVESN